MTEPQTDPIENQESLQERNTKSIEELSLEGIIYQMQSGIPEEIKNLSTEELEDRQEELDKLPYLSQEVFSDLVYPRGTNLGVLMVGTKDIVGSISSVFKNWSTEYDSRKGRAVNIAEQLINPTPESIDNVFHINNPSLGIRLRELSTPEGSLFFVIDGSHRVAGCKLAQVQRIPAFVEKIPERKVISTNSNFLKSDWEKRIKCGLIAGYIKEEIDEDGGKGYVLNIETQLLPWMYLPRNQLVKMNRFYFNHFPKAKSLRSLVNKESLPNDLLTDEMVKYAMGKQEYTE